MPTRDVSWPVGTPCWVDLQVDDLDAAGRFYGELFGWSVEEGPAEAGGYRMCLRQGRAAAGIGPKPRPMPSARTTNLATDDVDATAAAVTEAGGQVMMPPFDVMDVGRMTVAADPTGGVVGLWQAGSHTGAGIFNEPGAYAWNELHTRDYAAAQAFYGAVLGYGFTEIGDGEQMTYSTFAVAGSGPEAALGGCADDSGQPGEGAYWLMWFGVADCDASAATAQSLGGGTSMPPTTTPFGRMAIVTGVEGEAIGLIDLTSRT